VDYRYQPGGRAPIDAGELVSGNGKGEGYRYQMGAALGRTAIHINNVSEGE
jgi:hypothetical protein